MAMNQSALYFLGLGERFTYPECRRTTHRKFSTGFWSQSLRRKLTQNGRISWSLTEFQRLEFQKFTRKSLFLQWKCLVNRTVMIQGALHSPDIGERFTCSECMHTTHRKFSTGFWRQNLCQKSVHFVSEALPSFRIFYHFVRFFVKPLTSEARRKFSMHRTHTFCVRKTFSYIREM